MLYLNFEEKLKIYLKFLFLWDRESSGWKSVLYIGGFCNLLKHGSFEDGKLRPFSLSTAKTQELLLSEAIIYSLYIYQSCAEELHLLFLCRMCCLPLLLLKRLGQLCK